MNRDEAPGCVFVGRSPDRDLQSVLSFHFHWAETEFSCCSQYSKLKPGIHYTISAPIFLSGEVNESQSQSADLIDSTENHVVVYDGQFSCHCLQSWYVYDD